jgi:imidazolonepropionase-like amidohydrolase
MSIEDTLNLESIMKRYISILLFLLLWATFVHGGESKLAIKAGKIYTGLGRVIHNGVLLIENGKIIGADDTLSIPQDFKVYDFSSKVVIPGLIDAHSHVGEVPFPDNIRTSDFNESSQALTPMVDIRDSLNYWSPTTFELALASGVTTVMALPGSSNVIGGIGTVLKTAGDTIHKRILRPQGVLKMAMGMNPKSAGKRNNRVPKTRMGVRFLMWKSFNEAKQYKEKWDKYLKDPNKQKKPELDISKEPLRKALERKMPVHIHVVRADDIITACNLARDFGLDVSLAHVYEGYLVADELAVRGIPVVTGPGLKGWRYGREGEMPVNLSGILAEAGVKVAIMTDAIHFCDMLLQASFAVRLGMDETDAMKAITIHAAEISKVDNRVGSLERGKDADFIILNGPPFEVTTRVERVFIEGKEMFPRVETHLNK